MVKKTEIIKIIFFVLFVILGLYIILHENQIGNGLLIIGGGVSLFIREVISWAKELKSLFSDDNQKVTTNQEFPFMSPQVGSGTQKITYNFGVNAKKSKKRR
nr:hypothetical protein [Candidatus Woesearchaeota archaeon]